LPRVRVCMRRMRLDVRLVRLDELGRILDHQQILGILLFGRLGEIEGAGDHRGPVDHYDFVVGNGVLVVDERLDARIDEKRSRTILLRLLRFITFHRI